MQRDYWKFNETSVTYRKYSLFSDVMKISEEPLKRVQFLYYVEFPMTIPQGTKISLFSMMKEMHFCFTGNYCLASRCKLHFPWYHCPSERGLLLLFSSAKPVIAWKQAYETLSHETFVLELAREILMDGFS